jgi:dipeptidyl aminopeptidase/acylaminoacyl peptidase
MPIGGDPMVKWPLVSASPLTPEDLASFRWVDHVRLSPSGDLVAHDLSWANLDARQNHGRVRVSPLKQGALPLDVRPDATRDHAPEWSPDGSRIAFLGRRGARDQLFVLSLDGADAVQLTSLPDGVLGATWSPDGSSLAFTARVLADPDAVVDDPRPPEGEEQTRRPPIARVVRGLGYKRDGIGYLDGRHAHVFVVPTDGGEPRQVSAGPWSVEAFDWSPDGRSLVVAGDAEPDADLRRTSRLYVLDVDAPAGTAWRSIAGEMELAAPAWSPRGDLVAFVAPLDGESGRCERVWVVPAAGGAPRCLTEALDRSVGGTTLTDMRGGHGLRVQWSEDGERIYFLASDRGTAELRSVDLAGRVTVEVAADRRSLYDFDVRAGRIAVCAADAVTPGEVLLVEDGRELALTDVNPWLADRFVAQPERHVFTAADGLEIEGWLFRPPGFDPARRHPLVLQIHGGPHGQYGWAFFHEFQVLAGLGMLVLALNPRGSDGYGEAFKRACVRDWGGGDYEDLMTSLDQLLERVDFVDESRLGVAGGSYGGFMTNWIIGHTDRFAAAVSMRSITNLVSEFAQHDIVLWGELEMGPRPWPDPDELWRRSPIRYVNEMRTPLLLLHGEMDLRCAISQAEELFGALRLLGREVELVRFPGESHDLSRSGRPDRRVERLRRIAGWFQQHLLDS